MNYTSKDLLTISRELNNEQEIFNIFSKSEKEIRLFINNLKDLAKNKTLKDSTEKSLKIITENKNKKTIEFNETLENFKEIELNLKTQRPKLEECIKKQASTEELKRQNISFKSNLVKLENSTLEMSDKLTNIQSQITILESEKMEMKKKFNQIERYGHKDVNESHAKFMLLKNEYINTEKKLIELEEQNQIVQDEKNKLSTTLKEQETKIDHINKQNLLSLKAQAQEKIAKNLQLKEDLQINISKKNVLEQDIVILQNTITGLKKDLDQVKLDFQSKNENLNRLKREFDYFKLTEAIDLCLKESHNDSTCVVCKSPFLSDKINHSPVDYNEMNIVKTKLEKEQSTLNKVNTNKEIIQKQIDEKNSDLKTLQNKITQLEQDFQKKWTQQEDLPFIEKTLQESTKLIFESKIEELNQKIENINAREIDFTKLTTAYENNRVRLKQLEAQLNNSNNHREKLTKDTKELHDKIHLLLGQFDIKLDSLNNVQDKLDELKIKVNSYAELNVKIDNNLKDQTHLNESLEKSKENIQEIKSSFNINKELIEKNIEYIQSITLSDPKELLRSLETQEAEKREAHEKIVRDVQQLKINLAELNSKHNNYIDQISALEVSIEQFKTILGEIITDYQHTSPIEKPEHTHFNHLLTKLRKVNTDEDLEEDILDIAFKNFQDELQTFDHKLKEIIKKKSEIHTIIEQKNKYEKKIQDISAELKIIQKNYDQLETLHQLIGKDEFRNYVLSIIESQLIDQTNAELKTLCNGRYNIIQTNKTNRMASEFKIIDYFNDGMNRKVSTLSGGETFLVSLAMALALAELTRGQAQIDSLFIDEGFGTLDSDSIDEVFELLNTIQHSGKQIGIISHVQNLTSRIPINIHLDKNNLGNSTIKLQYN